MINGNTVRLDFVSAADMFDLVQLVSDYVAQYVGLDEEAVHWVGISVRESVINAIKHGNRGDETKRVYVEFTALKSETPPGMSIRVRDEGEGFDPQGVPDPLAPENLLKTSGRGIFLIRSFMDEMTISRAPQGGMELVMVKRVATSNV
jgi:serine/threonine-protein kinase RsbW